MTEIGRKSVIIHATKHSAELAAVIGHSLLGLLILLNITFCPGIIFSLVTPMGWMPC